ncbi:MAG: hypothetical protein IKL84_03275 [Clostridia bacterium]|nr:hypothetical protein [Clostridia bacterium]
MKNYLELIAWEMRKLIGRRMGMLVLLLLGVIQLLFLAEIPQMSSGWQEKDMTSHVYSGLDVIAWEKSICMPFDGRIFDDAMLAEIAAREEEGGPLANNLLAHDELSSLLRQCTRREMVDIAADTEQGIIWGKEVETIVPVKDCIGNPEAPALYRYTRGWQQQLDLFCGLGICVAVALVLLIAPLFADESGRGTDALLLSALHGRGRLAWAKVSAGLLLTFGLWLTMVILNCGVVFACYGFSGGDGDIRLMRGMTFFDYDGAVTTCAELIGTILLILLALMLMTAAGTMLISALVRGSFVSLAISAIAFLLPLLISAPFVDEMIEYYPTALTLVLLCPINAAIDLRVAWHRFSLALGETVIPYLPLIGIAAGLALVLSGVCTYFLHTRRQVK